MAFQGSLAELPLPDILQLVAVSGKTGSFTIANDRESGQIFLSDGQIVHARLGALEGEEAVYELAIWPEGEFQFTPDAVTVPTTINKSNTSLLMEAARRIDEWKVLARRVPSTALVPVFTEDGGATTVSLSPEEWAVVREIDSNRSIDEIAAALGSSPFETSKVVFGLITNGLVSLADDAGRLPVDRLRQMTSQELTEVARMIENEARAFLAGHEQAGELEARVSGELEELSEDARVEAVTDLIRSTERHVSTALGPNQAKAFLDLVGGLVTAQAKGA